MVASEYSALPKIVSWRYARETEHAVWLAFRRLGNLLCRVCGRGGITQPCDTVGLLGAFLFLHAVLKISPSMELSSFVEFIFVSYSSLLHPTET